MFVSKSISTNKVELTNNIPNTTEQASQESSPLDYMTGIQAERFSEFIDSGVIHKSAEIDPVLDHSPLPSLTEIERLALQTDLLMPRICRIDEELTISISAWAIIKPYLDPAFLNPHELQTHALNIIGSYINYFLIKRTTYGRRVAKELGLQKAIEKHGFFTQPYPSDIDITVLISALYNLGQKVDGESLRKKIMKTMASILTTEWMKSHLGEDPAPVYKKIVEKLYEAPFIDFQSKRFMEVTFQDLPFDFVFHFSSSSTHVFSWDDLYIPIEELFDDKKYPLIAPSSREGTPCGSFIRMALGFFKIDDKRSLDVKSYFRFINLLVKGAQSIQNGFVLKDEALARMTRTWFRYDRDNGVVKLAKELGKWIKKHYVNNPDGAFTFMFTVLSHLQNFLSQEEIAWILKQQTFSTQFPALALMNRLLDQGAAFNVVESLLVLAGFLGSPHYQIGTLDLRRPFLQCNLNNSIIALELEPDTALRNIVTLYLEHPDIWDKIEPLMIELFLHLRPFDSKNLEIPKGLTAALEKEGLSFEEVKKCALDISRCPSLLLRYIGTSMVAALPNIEDGAKRIIVEEQFHSLLPISEDKEGLRAQVESFLGAESIPAPLDPLFFQNWITALFEHGRNSEETAYKLWKSEFEKGNLPLSFSFALITRLTPFQTQYASRLFYNLKRKKVLEKEPQESIACIAACTQLCKEKGINYQPFIDQIGLAVLHMLQSGNYEAVKDKLDQPWVNWLQTKVEEGGLHRQSLELHLELLLQGAYSKKKEIDEAINRLIDRLEHSELGEVAKEKLQMVFFKYFSFLDAEERRDIIVLCRDKKMHLGSKKMGSVWLATLEEWLADEPEAVNFIAQLFEDGKKNYAFNLKKLALFKIDLALATTDENYRFCLLGQIISRYPDNIKERDFYPILKRPCTSLECMQKKYAIFQKLCAIEPSIATDFINQEIAFLTEILDEEEYEIFAAIFDAALAFFKFANREEIVGKFISDKVLPALIYAQRNSIPFPINKNTILSLAAECGDVRNAFGYCQFLLAGEEEDLREKGMQLFFKKMDLFNQMDDASSIRSFIKCLSYLIKMGKKKEVIEILSKGQKNNNLYNSKIVVFLFKNFTATKEDYSIVSNYLSSLTSKNTKAVSLSLLPEDVVKLLVLLPNVAAYDFPFFHAYAEGFCRQIAQLHQLDVDHRFSLITTMIESVIDKLNAHPFKGECISFVKDMFIFLNESFKGDNYKKQVFSLIKKLGSINL